MPDEERPLPVEQLTKRDRERVYRLMFKLDEYHAGHGLGVRLEHRAPAHAPVMRFLKDAHLQLWVTYYMPDAKDSEWSVLGILRSIGMPRYAGAIEQTLQRCVGKSTFGKIVKAWRNKGIAHVSFTGEPLDEHVFRYYDPRDPKQLADYTAASSALDMQTLRLRELLREAYPGAGWLLDGE